MFGSKTFNDLLGVVCARLTGPLLAAVERRARAAAAPTLLRQLAADTTLLIQHAAFFLLYVHRTTPLTPQSLPHGLATLRSGTGLASAAGPDEDATGAPRDKYGEGLRGVMQSLSGQLLQTLVNSPSFLVLFPSPRAAAKGDGRSIGFLSTCSHSVVL